MTVRWLHGVLASDLPRFLALGWVEVARDRRPSAAEDIVIVEWRHRSAGKPPIPKRVRVRHDEVQELYCDVGGEG